MSTYARKNISFTRGEGVWLWAESGEKFLDALSGIAVCGIGHAHPEISDVISQQAKTLIHTSNIYRIAAQEQLGEELCSLAKMDRAFFCNSGAEANEAAIKLARLHGHARQIEKPAIIVCEHSFHGRTLATLTATGSRKAHAGFEPLVSGFVRAPYDDSETIDRVCQANANISAVLVEPIQGEGGIRIPAEDYLQKLRTICDQHKLLFMLDEVQTGNGRTGEWFAFQHSQIVPDVLTTAKGLGNGMPIGVCMARGQGAELFGPGTHGSTFGGNPLACATALTVLKTINNEALIENARVRGEQLIDAFRQQLESHPLVIDIRGLGLMIGIELATPCTEIVDMAIEKNLLLNVTADKVIRLLPPLIISTDHVDMIVSKVVECIQEFSDKTAS